MRLASLLSVLICSSAEYLSGDGPRVRATGSYPDMGGWPCPGRLCPRLSRCVRCYAQRYQLGFDDGEESDKVKRIVVEACSREEVWTQFCPGIAQTTPATSANASGDQFTSAPGSSIEITESTSPIPVEPARTTPRYVLPGHPRTEKRLEATTPVTEVNSTSETDNVTIIMEKFLAMYPVDEWKSLGFFTDEYLKLINRHWLKFPPPSHESHYSIGIIYAFLMITGVSGNFLVIFMLLRCRSLRTPANILVSNLALSDMLMMLKTPVFIYNSFHFGPILGEMGCQIYGFIGGMTGIASIFFLAAIAMDRYNVISNPLDPVRKTTKLKAVIWALFIWCYSIFFSSLPLTGHKFKPYVPEGYLTSCSFDYMTDDPFNRWFIFIFFLASWVLPFCIITVCYCGICKAVLDTGMARKGQEKEKRKTELRLAVVVVAVIALWFVAWTPYAVVALLGITGRHSNITPLSSMIPAVFCKTASCVDPFVYALSHPRLRKELGKIFCYRRYQRERAHNTVKSVWKTDASRSSVKMPDGVEEITVSVEGLRQQSFEEVSSLSEGTVIVPLSVRQNVSPPSWYVPPKPKRNRSTSLKLKSKDEITPAVCSDIVTA